VSPELADDELGTIVVFTEAGQEGAKVPDREPSLEPDIFVADEAKAKQQKYVIPHDQAKP
jgi:hypothetical protein